MGLFGFGSSRSDEVVARGTVARATVVGIVVTGDDPGRRTVDYALDVEAPEPFRGAVRLGEEPPMVIRLGSDLQVVHLDSQVVIDWLGSGAEEVVDTQPLKLVPATGILDRTLGLYPIQRRGVPATATIQAAEVRPGSRGTGSHLHLTLYVERHGLTGYETELAPVWVPHYASHLCTVTRILPVWVVPDRPDDVVIDWPAAATADPGIDEPAAPILADVEVADASTGRGSRSGRRGGGPALVGVAQTEEAEVVIDLTDTGELAGDGSTDD